MATCKGRVTIIAAVGWLLGMILAGNAAAQTITMYELKSPPTLDGNGSDWRAVQGTVIPMHKSKPDVTTSVKSILVKGGVYAGNVYLYIEWQDSTQDVVHKPWIWDQGRGKYVKGAQREDRLAIQFLMQGEYSTNWLSGQSFRADMWHWKANRSNSAGLAHDKSTQISADKLLRAYKATPTGGRPVYIARPSDDGDKLYETKRYHKYVGDIMKRYVVAEDPKGSVADVQAKGVWNNGKWHLEICRKLDTGYSDDVIFSRGQTILGGFAVFDRSENDDHVVSDNLTFQF